MPPGVSPTPAALKSRVWMQGLAADGAKLAVYDPKVEESQIMKDLACPKFEWDHPHGHFKESPVSEAVSVVCDPYVACQGAHALCILTEWDEFRNYDFERIYDSMMKPAFCFDG